MHRIHFVVLINKKKAFLKSAARAKLVLQVNFPNLRREIIRKYFSSIAQCQLCETWLSHTHTHAQGSVKCVIQAHKILMFFRTSTSR